MQSPGEEVKIHLLSCTPSPLDHIGRCAGYCWGAKVDSREKNVNRAKECIKSGHGRVLEYVEVTAVIEDLSARAIRELYTHIAGTTRLQASTRYIDESGFEYFTPPSCNGLDEYKVAMDEVRKSYTDLVASGVPKEDAANLLPIGMMSKMVWKVNLRSLVNFFQQRLCMRAYHEIREFAKAMKVKLREIDPEWKWIAESLFVPKCEIYKYRNPDICFCTEDKCCGRHKKLEDMRYK